MSGNNCYGNNNAGAGTGYGILIDNNANETTVCGNHCRGNDTNYTDNGTNTLATGNNTA